MPVYIRSIDELRADLRRVRARLTVREIARAAGVGRTTINLLLADGDAPTPTTATVRKLSAWLDRNGAPAPTPDAPLAPADEHARAYWQGVTEATLRMLEVAGVQLETMLDSGLLARDGVGDARADDAELARSPTVEPAPDRRGRTAR